MNRAFITVFGIAVFAAILFGSLAFDSVLAMGPQPKVTICHVDPDGDGPGPETLSVNSHSQAKHLAHGDHLGECFECDDGFTDPPTETCDDGANNGTPGFCNATCDGQEPAVCGDGLVTDPETCDDSGESSSCDADCTAVVCGDGTVNASSGEACDDGANNGIPGFCNAICSGQEPDLCGNGQIDAGEECDGADLGGQTCETVVVDGFNLEVNLLGNPQGNVKGYIDGLGLLACNSDCTFDTGWCSDTG